MRLLLLVLAMTLAVACSDDPQPDGATQITLAEWAATTCDALRTLALESTVASLAEIERAADAWEEAVTALDRMQPPESARGYHRELLSLSKGVLLAQRDFIAATTAGDSVPDSPAAIEYQAELQRLFGAFGAGTPPAEVQRALLTAACDG